jgi:hypothetical protein
MKRYLFFGMSIFLCFFSTLSAEGSLEAKPCLQCGIYTSAGSNPGTDKITYHGKVLISANGPTYQLIWKIGRSQVQMGIGIFQNQILSVSFYDKSGRATGVVSYHLAAPGQLEGMWANFGLPSFGKEWLILDEDASLDEFS